MEEEAYRSEFFVDSDSHFFLFTLTLRPLALLLLLGGGCLVLEGVGVGVMVVFARLPPSFSSSSSLYSATGPPISRRIFPSSHPNHPTYATCAHWLGPQVFDGPHNSEHMRPCSQFLRPRRTANSSAGLGREYCAWSPSRHSSPHTCRSTRPAWGGHRPHTPRRFSPIAN